MVDLILLYVQEDRVGNPEVELLVLHRLEVHLESFEVGQHETRSVLDHHLSSSHLFRVARLAEVLVAKVQQAFLRELLHAVA